MTATLPRRTVLALAATALALPGVFTRSAFGQPASPAATPAATPAAGTDATMGERGVGSASAPVTVWEWFSMTCTHCAAFQRETFPRVKTELIDTGKVRWIWRDFPLDQVALTAAMVARALPPDRYEPFVTSLLATQDRWAYARGVNTTEELAKMAALAGMSRDTFNRTVADTALRTAILSGQETADKTYGVNSTPSFILNPAGAKKMVSGAVSYDDFAKAVASV